MKMRKVVVIVIAAIFGILFGLPTVYSETKSDQELHIEFIKIGASIDLADLKVLEVVSNPDTRSSNHVELKKSEAIHKMAEETLKKVDAANKRAKELLNKEI